MTGYVGKTTNLQREVVGAQAQAEREDMWGPMPGTIVSYDAATQTARIKPDFKKRKWDGSDLELPELIDVPVDLPRTGSAGMTFPIPPGTKVQLTPQMRSMENYDVEGNGSFSDARSFNLSDMRASVVGGDSASAPMENVDAENTHMRFSADGQYGIKGSPDGKFRIDGSEGNLYDIIATFMELVASDQLMINYGSSQGTGHRLFNQAQLMELAAKVRAMAL